MTPRRFLAPIALAAILLLPACVGPFDWALGGGGAGPGPSTSAGPGGSGPDADGDGESATPGGVAEADGKCPVGNWVMDNDAWAAELTTLWQQAVPGAAVTVSGVHELEWAEHGVYVVWVDDARIVATGTVDGTPFEQVITHDGTEMGAWEGSGSSYTLTPSGPTGVTSTVSLTVPGMSGGFESVFDGLEPWGGTMTVSCLPGGMTTTVAKDGVSGTVTWRRA